MELRHLRYFLAVAQEGNFTRAAARVGIGQPPLSQQIRDLEGEIGVALFHRVPHGAELTDAGQAFLEAVRRVPDQVAAAVRAAQRAGRGEVGALSVGFTGSAAMNPLIIRAIRTFRHAYPDVDLTLTENNSALLSEAMRSGTIDISFMRADPSPMPDMQLIPFVEEVMVLALPSGHPALPGDGRGAVALASLGEALFILTPRAIGPGMFDTAVGACEEAGFYPRLGQSAPQMASMLALVAAGEGVSMVPASMRQLALEGVTYAEISDVRPVTVLSVVHLRTSRSAMVQNFISIVKSMS